MRIMVICTTAILIGFISGALIAKPFCPPRVTLINPPVPENIQPTKTCGDVGLPDCVDNISTTTAATSTVPEPDTTSSLTAFATEVTFRIGESTVFTDGLSVSLIEISYSSCKPDVQCIWAGELAPQLLVTGGDYAATEIKITLGSSRTQAFTQGSYSFTLTKATETSATINIKKTNATAKIAPTIVPTAKVAGATATPKPTVAANTQNPSPFASEVANLITAATTKLRTEESLPAFKSDTALSASAKKYSSRLLADDYLSHIDKNGCDLTCRFDESGYLASSWGENLAMMEYDERPSAEYVANFFMTQWQKSAGHRKNLLSPTFTHQGVGVNVANGKIYVVVYFTLPE